MLNNNEQTIDQNVQDGILMGMDKKSRKSLEDCEYCCSYYTAEGKFLRILFSVKNDTKEPVEFNIPNLFDNKDRRFQRVSLYDSWVAPEGYSSDFYGSINPGITKKYYVYYDIPKYANGLYWKGEDDQYKYKIDLGI